jgi:hypothetical protein
MINYAIRLRATVDEQGALIKALLTHPMENGFRRNAAGEIAAAHYITEITLRINDEPVTTLLTGSGIAANPLFGWRIDGVPARRYGDHRLARQPRQHTSQRYERPMILVTANIVCRSSIKESLCRNSLLPRRHSNRAGRAG